MSLTSYRAAPPRGNGKRGTRPAPQGLCSSGNRHLEERPPQLFQAPVVAWQPENTPLRLRNIDAKIDAKFRGSREKTTCLALPKLPIFVVWLAPRKPMKPVSLTREARKRGQLRLLAPERV